ncbi:MAG: TIGR03089 family protein [Actinomycetales bacterium]|jgi:uncharacterized protein (TIGR03089 family)|nr:TIGR03089 family protein [Actinomycetales bacterium]
MPLPGLLARITAEPGRPRLTWYGADGERVELSGHVLDNWVTKTANLLVEEYQAGPLTRVLVDLPVHWRAIVWSMATWRVGACVGLPPATRRPDLVVTTVPTRYADVDVVAVALPALARHFDGELPVGAVDATSAVMTYGDVLTWMPEPTPTAPALKLGEQLVAHAGLETWAAETAARLGTWSPGERVLLVAPDDALEAALAVALTVYEGDGSLVLCSAGVAEDARERLAATERVGARVVL